MSTECDSDPAIIRKYVDEVTKRLGYLPLAIDLAGAYMSNEPEPEQAISQYLVDYDRNHDTLLQINDLQGLLPTEKTVWTVWDTTIEKIDREHAQLQPGLLLTFLAHFKGNIIQNDMFRLASLGISAMGHELVSELGVELREFIPVKDGEWDAFVYRQSLKVLARYSLVRKVQGDWEGTTMHSLVRWKAKHRNRDQLWQRLYTNFVLAACCHISQEDHPPDFRRHLIEHVPSIEDIAFRQAQDLQMGKAFSCGTFANLFCNEGRWKEAEQLFALEVEYRKMKFCEDHPDTLASMYNLANTLLYQSRVEEAEQLLVQVIQTSKTKLGDSHPMTIRGLFALSKIYTFQHIFGPEQQFISPLVEVFKSICIKWGLDTTLAPSDGSETIIETIKASMDLLRHIIEFSKENLGEGHPSTLDTMAKYASLCAKSGQWEEAEQLMVHVRNTLKMNLGEDHPHTLTSMVKLVSIYSGQHRFEEAERLLVLVIPTIKAKLGEDHPKTLQIIRNLATVYEDQGRFEKAEQLFVHVIEAHKKRSGIDDHDTLANMGALASKYKKRDRWKEAETIEVQVMETYKTKFGVDNLYTQRSMANLALTYKKQGRWEEERQLNVQIPNIKLVGDNASMLGDMESPTPQGATELELCAIRKQALRLPPPLFPSHLNQWTALYLVSPPLPANFSALQFDIISNCLWYRSRPLDEIWSWFEVSILGPHENMDTSFDDLNDNIYIKSCPNDFESIIQEHGYYFKEIPDKGREETSDPSPRISFTFAKNSIQADLIQVDVDSIQVDSIEEIIWQDQSVLWTQSDSDGEGPRFFSIVEEGDRLAIWVRVQLPESVNSVKEVKISLSY